MESRDTSGASTDRRWSSSSSTRFTVGDGADLVRLAAEIRPLVKTGRRRGKPPGSRWLSTSRFCPATAAAGSAAEKRALSNSSTDHGKSGQGGDDRAAFELAADQACREAPTMSLDFYASQSVFSEPGKLAQLYSGLPRDPAQLARIARDLIVHRVEGELF